MKENRVINRKTEIIFGILTALLAVTLMILAEQFLRPSYWWKSLLKIVLFGGGILLYAGLFREKLNDVLNLRKKAPARWLIFLVIGAYLFIIAAYFLLKNRLDLAHIREQLLEKEHLTRENFVFVFLYIMFINSFLEEAFFRGFCCYILKKPGFRRAGIIVSAFLFSVYHMGILSSWMHPLLFILVLAGLFAAGLFLSYLSEKQETLLAGWMIHAGANLAINTIGTFMILSG